MSSMLMAVIRKGQAERLMKAARTAGAPGGTVFYARGTASNTILAALGRGDSSREVLVSFIPDSLEQAVLSACRASHARGVLLIAGEDEEKKMDTAWTMIQIICEEGFSEDIMATARKAGAGGGTVIHAHGTSTEADVRFFGSPLVPEKEILMIIVEKEKEEAVISAVSSMEVLKKKGRAVIFSLPVKTFTNLS